MMAAPTSYVSLIDCDKIKETVSPLQIIDYSKIRDKARSVSFTTLKAQILTCGFREEISTIFGIKFLPPFTDDEKKQFKKGLSIFRNMRLNFDLPVIGLIDGAQRIEAICQLMDTAQFPITYVINVTIPDPAKYTASSWDFSKVVQAAYFLNQVTKTDVPVSFWDRVKGFQSFIGAINKEYPELWQYGFQTRIAKAVFLINMQRMGSNFFECLAKKKRTAIAAKDYTGAYKSESWQVTSINNVKQHLKNMQCEHGVDFYCDEFEFFEAVLLNQIMDHCFSYIGHTGALSPGYALIINHEISNLYGLQRVEVDLHHPIFQKAAFQILLGSKSELELVCLQLRLFVKSTNDADRGSYSVSWFTEQKHMVELGLKQLKMIQDIKKKYHHFSARADENEFNASRLSANSKKSTKKRKVAATSGNVIIIFFFCTINILAFAGDDSVDYATYAASAMQEHEMRLSSSLLIWYLIIILIQKFPSHSNCRK